MAAAREFSPPAPRGALLAWVAFGLALSPIAPDLFALVLREPWAHASPLFALLLGFWALRLPPAEARECWPRLGLVVTLAAAVFGLLFMGAALPRIARLALPLGVLGLASRYGRPAFPAAWLALWIAPLPSALLKGMPGLATAWLGAARPFAPIGAAMPFAVEAIDAGLWLGWIGAGFAWHAALRLGLGRAWRWALVAAVALAAPALQILGFAVALHLGTGSAGDGEAARLAFRLLPLGVLCAIGLLGPELARAARARGQAAGSGAVKSEPVRTRPSAR